MDWKLNSNFTAQPRRAYADPGKAVEQALDRTENFTYGMVYVAYSFSRLMSGPNPCQAERTAQLCRNGQPETTGQDPSPGRTVINYAGAEMKTGLRTIGITLGLCFVGAAATFAAADTNMGTGS